MSTVNNWTCSICTFAENPFRFLVCSVCHSERKPQQTLNAADSTTNVSTFSRRHPNLSLSSSKSQLSSSNDDLDMATRRNKRRKALTISFLNEEEKAAAAAAAEETTKFVRSQVQGAQMTEKSTRDDSASKTYTSQLSEIDSTTVKGAQVPKKPVRDDDVSNTQLTVNDSTTNVSFSTTNAIVPDTLRRPPAHVVAINNLSDRQYCCVWNVEVINDGYRCDVARVLLATLARHVNPVLRARGWRVKRLIESCSRSFLGCCYTNGRNDADAASTIIQLNLRTQPHKKCQTFYSFRQVLSVLLHEITHTSIGLEDIHPPAFWDLLKEIQSEYYERLRAGEVELETDQYGCDETVITKSGEIKTMQEAAKDLLGQREIGSNYFSAEQQNSNDCGVSKKRNRRWKRRRSRSYSAVTQPNQSRQRPLLKGVKMIDGRTKTGKSSLAKKETLTPRQLAANAAMARLGSRRTYDSICQNQVSDTLKEDSNLDNVNVSNENINHSEGDEESDSEGDDDLVMPHVPSCSCRSCDWDNRLFVLY